MKIPSPGDSKTSAETSFASENDLHGEGSSPYSLIFNGYTNTKRSPGCEVTENLTKGSIVTVKASNKRVMLVQSASMISVYTIDDMKLLWQLHSYSPSLLKASENEILIFSAYLEVSLDGSKLTFITNTRETRGKANYLTESGMVMLDTMTGNICDISTKSIPWIRTVGLDYVFCVSKTGTEVAAIQAHGLADGSKQLFRHTKLGSGLYRQTPYQSRYNTEIKSFDASKYKRLSDVEISFSPDDKYILLCSLQVEEKDPKVTIQVLESKTDLTFTLPCDRIDNGRGDDYVLNSKFFFPRNSNMWLVSYGFRSQPAIRVADVMTGLVISTIRSTPSLPSPLPQNYKWNSCMGHDGKGWYHVLAETSDETDVKMSITTLPCLRSGQDYEAPKLRSRTTKLNLPVEHVGAKISATSASFVVGVKRDGKTLMVWKSRK